MPGPDPIPTDAALAAVRERFAQRHAQAFAPSTVYGILAGGDLIDSGGFGASDASGAAPGPDTAYRVASVTKSFTAAALLRLRDRGVLALDAPITDFVGALAGIRLPAPDSPVPTLRMLATMSAGLPSDDPWADRQESLSDADFDAILRNGISFASVPGTEYEYSNLGYALLGRAIQVAAGRPFRDLVIDEIVRPLGMRATGFTADVAASGGVATGYERVDGEWSAVPFSGPGAFSPIGGLFSTVRDLATWMQFFVAAHRGRGDGDGGLVLSTATRREMQQAYRIMPPDPDHPAAAARPPEGYGFGLVVSHHPAHGPIVSHSGGYPGFSAHIRWHPASGIGVVALENATYAGVSVPTAEALLILLDATAQPPRVEPWPETLGAQATVDALLREWDDATAVRLFAENVELDEPLPRRRAAIAAAVAAAGELGAIDDEHDVSPAHRTWRVHGTTADLRCEVILNPQHPPRVQSLEVTVDTATAS